MSDTLQQICAGCGAKQSFDTNQANLKCSHCGTEMAVERYKEDVPSALEANAIVPATVAVKDLRDLAHVHMTRGKHTPDDLLEKAQITETVISFVPTFLFRGNYEANWTASFGYDRQEAYTAYRTVNGEQQAYTAYRTVTDWRPASGVATGSFAVKSEGGEPSHPNATYLAEGMSLGTLEPYSPKFVSGFPVADFNRGPNDVFASSGEAKVKAVVDSGVRSHAQGNRQRDWRWNGKWNWESSTVLVPIAKASFEYEEKSYSVWFDGSNPSIFLGDALPQDQSRKKAIRAGFLPAAIAAVGTVATAIFPPLFIVSGFILVAAIVFGFLRRHAIISFSKSRREAFLSQKRAGESTNNDLSEDELAKLAQSYNTPVTPLLARTTGNLLRWVSLATGLAMIALSLTGFILIGQIGSGYDYGSSYTDNSNNNYNNNYNNDYGSDYATGDPTSDPTLDPTTDPGTAANTGTDDPSWVPTGFYSYGDGTSFAWKWDHVSTCDNSAANGCWLVTVSMNATCDYGVYVTIDETDSSDSFVDSPSGYSSDVASSGDLLTVQVNASYSGDNGKVTEIGCN